MNWLAYGMFDAREYNVSNHTRHRGLADKDNRGKLNIAEFHVAMGLIYRSEYSFP